VGAEYLNPSARLQNCIIQENKRSFTVEFGGENDPIYLMIQIGHVAHDRGISISPIGNEKPQQALALMIFGEMREDSLNKYLGPVAGGKFLSAEFNRLPSQAALFVPRLPKLIRGNAERESKPRDNEGGHGGEEAVVSVNGSYQADKVATGDFSEDEVILICLVGCIIGFPIIYTLSERGR